MLIEGYDGGPLGAGESLPARPGFWSNHLAEVCTGTAGGAPFRPEWFGEDGADVDAMTETLFDPERWPVLRVLTADGSGIAVVLRNQPGDYGTDYLRVPPGGHGPAQPIAGSGLTWPELIALADAPGPLAAGVEAPAVRLLLLIPLLDDLEVPQEAAVRVGAALTAVGVGGDVAPSTAMRLLSGTTGKPWHDPAWGSPLSN
ncbi:hypothetical protein ACIBL6_13175 [Streptomyces sp. NPDC050400]|uniref:hypothetical protein n=1 Tax=Streptomyces sp. NPDC050400 TaxID=3365610 RepID=UPI0037879ED5